MLVSYMRPNAQTAWLGWSRVHFVPTTPGIAQNEAVEPATLTRAEALPSEYSANANSRGRIRAPDVIDPYQISRARRKAPSWSIASEEADGDCGCM